MAVRASDLRHLDPEPQVDAMVAVQVGEDLRHLAAERPQQRQFRRLEHGHLDAASRAAAVASSPIQPAPMTAIRGRLGQSRP